MISEVESFEGNGATRRSNWSAPGSWQCAPVAAQTDSVRRPDVASLLPVLAADLSHTGSCRRADVNNRRLAPRRVVNQIAVNEPGLASSSDGQGEDGIDRSFEGTGGPKCLGE